MKTFHFRSYYNYVALLVNVRFLRKYWIKQLISSSFFFIIDVWVVFIISLPAWNSYNWIYSGSNFVYHLWYDADIKCVICVVVVVCVWCFSLKFIHLIFIIRMCSVNRKTVLWNTYRYVKHELTFGVKLIEIYLTLMHTKPHYVHWT